MSASYSGIDKAGEKSHSSKDPLGSSFFVAYTFEFLTSSFFNVLVGGRWSFYNFNLEKVMNAKKAVIHVDKEVYFHSPQIFVGLRF